MNSKKNFVYFLISIFTVVISIPSPIIKKMTNKETSKILINENNYSSFTKTLKEVPILYIDNVHSKISKIIYDD